MEYEDELKVTPEIAAQLHSIIQQLKNKSHNASREQMGKDNHGNRVRMHYGSK